jgi:hypothetical protein
LVSFGQSFALLATTQLAARLPVTRVNFSQEWHRPILSMQATYAAAWRVNVDFTTAQLKDALKSLTVLDLGKGTSRE